MILNLKRTAAAVLALAVIGGTLPAVSGADILKPSITANAAGSVSFDEETGVLTLSGNVVNDEVREYADNDAVKSVVALSGTVLPVSCRDLFSGFKCKSIDLSKADSSKVENMRSMFNNCKQLEELDLTGFDTSKVTDMEMTFGYCPKLKSLDLTSFDTSSVKRMWFMFIGCSSLSSLDLSSFDTTSVQNFDRMFMGCDSLGASMSTITGRSITLDGMIGANIYITPCENLAKAVLSGPDGDITITDFTSCQQENGSYKFTYPVNAVQMGEKITLKIFDSTGKQLILSNEKGQLSNKSQAEYSVRSYIEDSSKYSSDENLSALVNALDNYGKAAENYFLDAEYAVEGISGVSLSDVAEYATPSDAPDWKISLVLNAETSLRVYYNGDITSAKINNSIDYPETSQYGQYLQVKNIPGHKLMDNFTFEINGETLTCSPMSYVYRALDKDGGYGSNAEPAKAFFVYAKAVNEYIRQA